MTKPLPKLDDLIAVVDQQKRTCLEQLGDSVGLAGHLKDLAEELVGHFVDQARADGASWAEIGDAMGVTKQAAQKRFVTGTAMKGGKSLFARFDDAARSIIVGAQEYTREGGQDHVTTGHILLALLDDPDGVTSRAIDGRGISAGAVRTATQVALGPSHGSVPEHLPFAADAKKVLELALREAVRMQSGYIGAEHILLAILRDQKSLGARTLESFGIDRKDVLKAIAG